MKTMTKETNGNLDAALIKFSAKELFFEINRKIDLLASKNETKADAQRVDTLANVVSDIQRKGSDVAQNAIRCCDSLENKVDILEKESASRTAVADNDRRIGEQEKATKYQWIAIIVSALIGIGGLLMKLLEFLAKH